MKVQIGLNTYNDNRTYQISAAIQPGNSGGPLFDNSGNLIGITNASIPSAENVGYAIKITYLNNFLDLIPNFPPLPAKTTITALSFPEKIKALSKFTVLIKVTKPRCDMTTPNVLFDKIDENFNYDKVADLFKDPGDNFTNSVVGDIKIEYYRWSFCGSKDNSVECSFKNKKLFTSRKTFSNLKCNSSANANNYKLIKANMTYPEVCKILNSEGDRHTCNYPGMIISFYRWYNCDKAQSYIEVSFWNSEAKIIQKNNIE